MSAALKREWDGMSANARLIGFTIGVHADWGTGRNAFASLETIARESGRGRTIVRRSLAELVEHGWLTIDRQDAGRTKVYSLTIPEHPVSVEKPVEAPKALPVHFKEDDETARWSDAVETIETGTLTGHFFQRFQTLRDVWGEEPMGDDEARRVALAEALAAAQEAQGVDPDQTLTVLNPDTRVNGSESTI